MCGIVYVRRIDGKPASKMIAKRYKNQKTRGSDGFGFVAIVGDKIKQYCRHTTEKGILGKLETTKASEIMFHHRFPTSTGNFEQTAHPIKVSNAQLKYDYYLVHNGIIMNDTELKTKHEVLGFDYSTRVKSKWEFVTGIVEGETHFNDSESLAIELALAIEADADGVKTRGSIACIMLQVDKVTGNVQKIFWGRNTSNPLKLSYTKGQWLTLASEGDGELIENDTLFSFDYTTHQFDARKFTFGTTYSAYQNRLSINEYYGSPKEATTFGYNGYDNEYDDDEDEYWELLAEKDALQKEIEKSDLTEYEEQHNLDRLDLIEELLVSHDDKVLRRSLASQ